MSNSQSLESFSQSDTGSLFPHHSETGITRLRSDSVELYSDKPPTKRPRTSWIWKHGKEVVDPKTLKLRWQCSICTGKNPTSYIISKGSTDKPKDHLRYSHRIDEIGIIPEEKSPKLNQSIINMFRPSSLQHITTDGLKKYLVRWVVNDHMAFTSITTFNFQALVTYLNEDVVAILPSDRTMSAWVIQEFLEARQKIIDYFKSHADKVHFSHDLWTSPNYHSVLGIVAHWCHLYRPITLLLALKEVKGSHTGENLSHHFYAAMKEFSLLSKIGYFMMDNASNNNTFMTHLTNLLQYSSEVEKDIDLNTYRLRCFGHIINLVVRQLLFGEDYEMFEVEVLVTELQKKEEEELELWRKKGCIGKLHNLVMYVKGSTQRIDAFLELQQKIGSELWETSRDLMLVADNRTRWNSTYKMIQRAIKIKFFLDTYISKQIEARVDRYESLKRDQLTSTDWEELTHLNSLLEPFYKVTLATEGVDTFLYKVIPGMDLLLSQLEEYKNIYEHHPLSHMKHVINMGWSKLDQYYKLTDEVPAYVASVVLHPALKWQYFERKWKMHPSWIHTAKKKIKQFWIKEYKDTADKSPVADASNFLTSKTVDYSGDKDCILQSWMLPPSRSKVSDGDEYQIYCDLEPDYSIKNPLDWWKEHERIYPSLGKMARELLCLPAMSSEVERTFSSAKLTLTDQRASLDTKSLEAIECLRAWTSHKFVEI